MAEEIQRQERELLSISFSKNSEIELIGWLKSYVNPWTNHYSNMDGMSSLNESWSHVRRRENECNQLEEKTVEGTRSEQGKLSGPANLHAYLTSI